MIVFVKASQGLQVVQHAGQGARARLIIRMNSINRIHKIINSINVISNVIKY